MHFGIWLFIGGSIGILSWHVFPRGAKAGRLGDVFLGLLGAVEGGFLFFDATHFFLQSVAFSIFGAVVLLFMQRLLSQYDEYGRLMSPLK